MLRVLFLFGWLALGILLITAGAVFGARLSDQYVCLTLVNYSRDSLTLYDITHDFFAPETRYPLSSGWVTPADYFLTTTPSLSSPIARRSYTLALQSIEGGESIVLEEGFYYSTSMFLPSQSAWSTDARQFAYLWHDVNNNENLSIFNLEDRSKRTITIDLSLRSTNELSMLGWSGDAAYIALGEGDNLSSTKLSALLDTQNMSLLSIPSAFPLLVASAWAPTGHRLAGVAMRENLPWFLVLDPENLNDPIYVEVDRESVTQGISWSADSQYVAVSRKGERYGVQRDRIAQWYFDIFSRDGDPVAVNLVGKAIIPPSGVNYSPGMDVMQNVIPAFWSRTGQTWNFLQERVDRNHSRVSWVGFHPDTGVSETLEADIASELYFQMFESPIRYTYSPIQAIPPANGSLLIPQWRDDGIAFDYLNYREETRMTLLSGVDEVLFDAYSSTFADQFQWGQDHFVIPWSETTNGEVEAHLTIIRRAGGENIADVMGMEAIHQLRWMSEDWIGFEGTRDGVRGIEIVNLNNGVHHQVPLELPAENGFYAMASPDSQHLAIMLMPREGYSNADKGSLSFFSMEDGSTRFVSDAIYPSALWTPDGSVFAIARRDDQNNGLLLVSGDGDILANVDLRGELQGRTLSIYDWSRCEDTSLASDLG